MDNKKILGVLLHTSAILAGLYLLVTLVLNFIPQIVEGIYFKAGDVYEVKYDRFSIIGAASYSFLALLYYFMLLFKRKKGNIYRWYHVILTVVFALVGILFPVLMNMFSVVDATVLLGGGVISKGAYDYLNALLKATTMARFLNIVSVALFVGAFFGLKSKK